MLERQSRYDDADAALELAIAVDPEWAPLHAQRAALAVRRGDDMKAQEWRSRAREAGEGHYFLPAD